MSLTSIAGRFVSTTASMCIEPIGNGNINATYLVRGDGLTPFILQQLNHQVFKQPDAVARNIRAVTQYLQDLGDWGYRTPRPMAGHDGADLQRDDAGNYWRAFEYLPDTFAPEGMADAACAFESGKAYGAFLRALRDFPAEALAETIPGFHDTDRRFEVFEKILAENPAQRAGALETEIDALYRVRPLFDTISRLKKSGELPLRVTHNDTKAGNILLDTHSRKAVAVIDLDTVMPGTVLSDFGDMVRTFAPDCYEDEGEAVHIRVDVLQALTTGFLSQTGDFLTETEKNNLMPGACWIAGEQALRFLSDYIAGDVYYKIRYPEHNLVRARNQLSLLAALTTCGNPG